MNNGLYVAPAPKTSETFIKKIYINIKLTPAAKPIPIPPRLFLDDNEKATNVRITAEKGKLVRLYNSTLYLFKFFTPLFSDLSI